MDNKEPMLRVCPFCGGKGELLDGDPPIIRCVECFASIHGVHREPTDNLIKQWNTRMMLLEAVDIYDEQIYTDIEIASMLMELMNKYNDYTK